MKKTTAYARKRLRTGALFNGAEWMNAINRVRPYDEAPTAGFFSTQEAALKSEVLVKEALKSLLDCHAPPDAKKAHDLLAHALGVTVIRALQIQPIDNPMLPILKAGTDAVKRSIERYESTGAWGLDGPGRLALIDAIDVYTTVLQSSSPAQMVKATDERMKILNRRTRKPSGASQ